MIMWNLYYIKYIELYIFRAVKMSFDRHIYYFILLHFILLHYIYVILLLIIYCSILFYSIIFILFCLFYI